MSGALYSYAGSSPVQGLAACFWASLGFSVLSAVVELALKDNSGGLRCGRCLTIVGAPAGADAGRAVEVEME